MTDEDRRAFERDVAVRQAKRCEVDLTVIRLALTENRPLEALRQVTEALARLDEELDAIEDLEGGLDIEEDAPDGHADAVTKALDRLHEELDALKEFESGLDIDGDETGPQEDDSGGVADSDPTSMYPDEVVPVGDGQDDGAAGDIDQDQAASGGGS